MKVESYGSKVPSNQVATVTTPDARSIAIRPWDKKVIKDIEKAIMDSDVGITPENNGEVIALVFHNLLRNAVRNLLSNATKLARKPRLKYAMFVVK